MSITIEMLGSFPGSYMPETKWLLYAENAPVPLCRKLDGSYMAEDDIGLYAMLPEALACISTVLYSRHSDRYLERRWHFVMAALVAATALSAASLFSTSVAGTLTMFAIARAAIVSSLPVFWAMSTALLSERSSVAGIAVISSLSNLSGMTAPYMFGAIRSATGSLSLGLCIISGLIVLAAICVIARVPRSTARHALAADPSARSA
ncbi:hypothetical protein [Paraburkholderia sp. CNPSo 3281]|uniref:hypothetical protein n=1 Tax=Paraburkholderia sp. CNPSo 3281 TaxID=2940933 RepID=UPI0020B6E9A3|nr:hypothetical protein [Paraburkholderia sp. CNPSo 3281]MCP3720925.1 hypothetical protein [Paraburkholderia sp. CNPSo 3281]